MGSCISKCKPKMKQPLVAANLVHDKLVISQPPLTTPPLSLSNKISPFPPSPSASTSSLSSFTCVSSNTVSSSVSSLSTATSGFSSKELRLFSDEFLWSCYKENLHVVRINSLKAANASSSPARVLRLNSPARSVSAEGRRPSPQRASRSTPQKRLRSSSPGPATNLTRQKSLKKDQPPERPSPSRRFFGEKTTVAPVSSCRNNIKTNQARANWTNKETRIHRISSKIDEAALSSHDLDSAPAPMEDIENPLISLDCFIFL